MIRVRFLVAALLLALLLAVVPFRSLAACVRHAEPAPLAAAALLALMAHVLQAMRFWWLARLSGSAWSPPTALRLHFASLPYAAILPGGNATGIAVRAYRMGRIGGDYAEAARLLALDRALATATLCASGLLTLRAAPAPLLLGGIFAAVMTGCLLLMAALQHRPLLRGAQAWLQRVPRLAPLTKTPAAARHPSPAAWTLLSLWSLGLHAVGVLVYVLLAKAVGLSPGFVETALARAAMLVAALAPVSVGGLGLREGVAVLLLGGDEATRAPAAALGLLAFATTTLLPGLVGVLLEGRSRGH